MTRHDAVGVRAGDVVRQRCEDGPPEFEHRGKQIGAGDVAADGVRQTLVVRVPAIEGPKAKPTPTAVALAWLSRAATLVFLIFYTALDAIGGIGLGRSMLTVESLAASGQWNREQVDGVVRFLNMMWTDPWVGGVDSFISETGSWAVFVAALAAAIGLFLSRSVPWPPLLILVAFGWELQTSHASPHGPIAFGLLIIASAWIWWAQRRATA